VNLPTVSLRSRAGRSADERYKELRNAWRERVVGRYDKPALGAATVLLGWSAVRGYDLDWTLGFLSGTLLVFWGWVRESPPHHIEQWRTGAEAERRTAKVLRKLRRKGWKAVHDLADGKGNLDHVVVGPGGLFLLDTKAYGGRVTVDGNDVVHVQRVDNPDNGYPQPKTAEKARKAAIRLKNEIERSTGQRGLWVNAVIVVWSPFEQRIVDGDRIAFVHGEELAGWLESRPAIQQQAKTEALAAALSVAATASA
jgi:hypothetical protein